MSCAIAYGLAHDSKRFNHVYGNVEDHVIRVALDDLVPFIPACLPHGDDCRLFYCCGLRVARSMNFNSTLFTAGAAGLTLDEDGDGVVVVVAQKWVERLLFFRVFELMRNRCPRLQKRAIFLFSLFVIKRIFGNSGQMVFQT